MFIQFKSNTKVCSTSSVSVLYGMKRQTDLSYVTLRYVASLITSSALPGLNKCLQDEDDDVDISELIYAFPIGSCNNIKLM